MADKISPKQLGLTIGVLAAAIHFIWLILVGLFSNTIQLYLDWIFMLHLLKPVYQLIGFNFTSLILLPILAFIGGYISGYFLAVVYNWVGKK